MDTRVESKLLDALDDLSYPAQKWQITTCAEIYGADIHTRRTLYGLPARTYSDAADVVAELEPAAADEPVPAGRT